MDLRWYTDGPIFGYRGPENVAVVQRELDGAWRMLFRTSQGKCFAVFVNPDGIFWHKTPTMPVWALSRASEGTWRVSPSIHIPSQFHDVVTLVGVPEPAPWV